MRSTNYGSRFRGKCSATTGNLPMERRGNPYTTASLGEVVRARRGLEIELRAHSLAAACGMPTGLGMAEGEVEPVDTRLVWRVGEDR